MTLYLDARLNLSKPAGIPARASQSEGSLVMIAPVPVLSIVCCAITALIAFGAPVALTILCMRRSHHTLMAVCTGAICFILGALVLEQLFHSVMLGLFPVIGENGMVYILYGCLTAGLFEETARLVGLRFLCKKQDASAVTGFACGVGHGGIEAILLAGMTMLSNLMVMISINAGSADSLLAGLEGESYDAAVAQLQQASAIPPLEFLAGGIERLAAITLHIALSMLIWMVVTKRLPLWGYALAIGLHALANLPAGLYQVLGLNMWLTEAVVVVVTACIAFAVWKLYQLRREAPAES